MSMGNTKPDSATRTLVRRHVMREIAKARRQDDMFGKVNMFQMPPLLPGKEAAASHNNDEVHEPLTLVGINAHAKRIRIRITNTHSFQIPSLWMAF
jgi:hypothetical protein